MESTTDDHEIAQEYRDLLAEAAGPSSQPAPRVRVGVTAQMRRERLLREIVATENVQHRCLREALLAIADMIGCEHEAVLRLRAAEEEMQELRAELRAV